MAGELQYKKAMNRANAKKRKNKMCTMHCRKNTHGVVKCHML